MSRPREFDVEHVLHQCMEVFWTKGFKSTSYEDLTRSTRVKKQSLYGVFDDKRSLFLKGLVLYREQSLAMLEELVSRDVSPLQKLEAIRDTSLQGELPTNRGCLMVNSALEFGTYDEEVTREVNLMFFEVERILEKVIRSGQEQQLITNRHTSQALAVHLNNALIGSRILEKSGATQERIQAVLHTAFSLIVS